MVKNPNWQEADQLAFFQSVTRDYRETNPASDRVQGLEPVTSGLQHQRPKTLDHAASSYNDHNFFNKVEHSRKSTLRTQKMLLNWKWKVYPWIMRQVAKYISWQIAWNELWKPTSRSNYRACPLSVLIQNVNIMCISLLRENKGHHLAKQIPSLDTKDDPDLTHYPSFPN